MGGLGIIIQLPTLLCLGFLVIKFIILAVKGFNRYQREPETVIPLAAPIQLAYVKDLFEKPSLEK